MAAQSARPPRAPSICLLVARWGGWPAWTPLLLRTYAANADVKFTLIGDAQPSPALPSNVRFAFWPERALLERLRRTVGYRGGALAVNNHSTSKISDLKPMFGVVFPELLSGCHFWGNVQDDVLLGRLRDWFPPELLTAHDVFSPLPAPFDSCGPFMLYRNANAVNELFRSSADLERVLRDPRYLVFDEWWGALRGRGNMARVTAAAGSAGSVRVWNGHLDSRKRRNSRRGNKKALGWEDRLYGRDGVPSLDEGMVLSWEDDGTLWQGAGKTQPKGRPTPAGRQTDAAAGRRLAPRPPSAARNGARRRNRTADAAPLGPRSRQPSAAQQRTALQRAAPPPASVVFDAFVPGAGFQLAFAHFADLKRRSVLGALPASASFERLAARASGFALTRHGVWLRLLRGGHAWFSGAFPRVHAVVPSAALHANLARAAEAIAGTRARPSAVDRIVLPCVAAVRAEAERTEAERTTEGGPEAAPPTLANFAASVGARACECECTAARRSGAAPGAAAADGAAAPPAPNSLRCCRSRAATGPGSARAAVASGARARADAAAVF